VKKDGIKATSRSLIVCWFLGAGAFALTSILLYSMIRIYPLPVVRRSPGSESLISPIALLISLQTWTSAPESRMKLCRRGNSSSSWLVVVKTDRAKLWCWISFFSIFSDICYWLVFFYSLFFFITRSTAAFFSSFLSCSLTIFLIVKSSLYLSGAELLRYMYSGYQ
jgi:hypothetical protein